MANFKKHERQKIVDNYLNDTGKNRLRCGGVL